MAEIANFTVACVDATLDFGYITDAFKKKPVASILTKVREFPRYVPLSVSLGGKELSVDEKSIDI